MWQSRLILSRSCYLTAHGSWLVPTSHCLNFGYQLACDEGCGKVVISHCIYSLYRGSCHLSCQHANHCIGLPDLNLNAAAGLLTQITQWSLIVTSPKARKLPLVSGKKATEMKIPSMAQILQWWVGTGVLLCKVEMTSTRFNLWKNSCSIGPVTSSFMSARSIIWSPSACRWLISSAKSSKILVFGQVEMRLVPQYCKCCWSVDNGPGDTQG